MTEQQLFTSHAAFYEKNTRDGHTAKAVDARLETPDGAQENAIAIFTSGHLRIVIPTRDAIRLATQIADIATEARHDN